MLDVYHEFFEVPFLKATEKYYKAESAAFVTNNSVSDYLKKAEDRLSEEMDRINLYLHDSTRKSVSESFKEIHRSQLTRCSSRRSARRR